MPYAEARKSLNFPKQRHLALVTLVIVQQQSSRSAGKLRANAFLLRSGAIVSEIEFLHEITKHSNPGNVAARGGASQVMGLPAKFGIKKLAKMMPQRAGWGLSLTVETLCILSSRKPSL